MEIQEFLDKFTIAVPESGCFLWTRGATHNYGYLYFNKKVQRANRIAYELANGPIPDGLIVRHKCDVPLCVNPNHLILGTKADNTNDAVIRRRFPVGEKRAGSKLTTAQVIAIRADTRVNRLIAADYGIHPNHISRLKLRTRWRHLD